MPKSRVKNKSITRRWLFNSFGVIFVVLVLVTVVLSVSIRNYYYSTVQRTILYHADYAYNDILKAADDTNTNFTTEVRNLVETFEEKDKIEMMAIGYEKEVLVTSSGFSYQAEHMPDYEEALLSADGIGYYIGELSFDEKVMAVTKLVPVVNSDYSAIRYVVSLQEVDRVVLLFILGIIGVMVLVLILVLISGIYFVKSIVMPVQELGSMARQFASGDMSVRMLKKSDDEIGELCDIINYMADEIESSEKMKNEFISSVSHELRTPLTAIKGWGETLATLGAEDTAMMRKGLYVITNETERLSDMVEDLLDFSRIQNGKFTLVKTKMDLLAELEDAVLIYAERARRDNMELIYHEPETLPFVFGDRNRLKQVFINVIDNALKYSDAGATVTVTVKEEDGTIVVTVVDTGIGISEEDLPKIKEKFYKANSTRRGSGIGLAVANEIVILHDGTLEVDSALNEGTTVTIKLPVMPNEDMPTEITVH